MSASPLPALRATALQATSILARYERHVRRLAATWLDMDLYRTVSAELDEIRSLCALLPQVTLPWVGLLVSHAELIHALWSNARQGGPTAAAEVDHQLRAHLACIDALARRCLRSVDVRAPDALVH